MKSGLKDRNKKEIKEGDFLSCPDGFIREKLGGTAHVYLVGFINGCFQVGRREDMPKNMDTYLWLVADHCEIIGNLKKTPNMLTVKNWNLIDPPKVELLKDKTKKKALVADDGVKCTFCSTMMAPKGGKVTVGNKCKCGAEVVDI